jgi:hypothetical protein
MNNNANAQITPAKVGQNFARISEAAMQTIRENLAEVTKTYSERKIVEKTVRSKT